MSVKKSATGIVFILCVAFTACSEPPEPKNAEPLKESWFCFYSEDGQLIKSVPGNIMRVRSSNVIGASDWEACAYVYKGEREAWEEWEQVAGICYDERRTSILLCLCVEDRECSPSP